MTRVNVLLIESLDCPGTTDDDARLRVAALREGGFAPRALAVAPPGLDPAGRGAPVPVVAWRDGPAAVRRALEAHSVELAIVASAAAGGGAVARWLPSRLPARWWPSAVGGARPRFGPWPLARGLDALEDAAGTRAADLRPKDRSSRAALEWAVVDEDAAARRRLPLWDGDYLLVPAPLERRSGAALLASFAGLACDHDGLDLIVLGHPQPSLGRLARALGVGMRVHFVGPATREAEFAWLKPAAGLVVAGPGPLAAGVVLRALAAGCPVVAASPEGVGGALHGWLEARASAAPDGGTADAMLERVLERGGAIERAIERGRRASAAHHARALGARLAAALAPAARAGEGRRAA